MGRKQKILLSWVLCTIVVLLAIHGSKGFVTSPSPEISSALPCLKERTSIPGYLIKSRSKYATSPVTFPEGSFPVISPEPHKAKVPSYSSHASFTSHPRTPAGRMLPIPASAPSYPIPPPPYHPGRVISPVSLYPPVESQNHRQRRHAPPPYIEGPSLSPIHASSSNSEGPTTSSPTPTVSSTQRPIFSPMLSPSGSFSMKPRATWPQPVKALPPPPPNLDCGAFTCTQPLTNSPPGSPCACVLPMKVGLRVSVALYTFFPLVSELAREIASGIFMEQSQVRIIGANAASGEPEKAIVLINLVPLGEKFDNTTACLTSEKFWHKQISIKASFFGDYDILYVLYPGLPPSPHTAPARTFGNGNNPKIVHPLAADVKKPEERHNGSLVAFVVLSSVIPLVLCVGVALALFLKHRYHTRLDAPTPQASLAKSSVAGTGFTRFGSRLSSESASLRSSLATHIGSVKSFSLAEIERATDEFNDSRIIGEGGFGRVYEGTLEDGTRVAVKVLKRDDQQGGREFLAEVEMLSRLHHRNLVKLIGTCTEDYILCLVYELISNGSVESHLYGVDKETAPLDWNARMKIALGAARCLAYLHEDLSPHVIHRDFKSSNILLEHDFTPKVCDFGLARTALGEQNDHISTRVMGTFGYVAPEYAMTGHLLVKSDVYSYGVVLLELLTGRKPVDMLRPPGQENLVTWARPLLTSKEGLEAIIDPALGTSFPFDSLAKVAAIALMCVQPEVSHRPFMGEVFQALKLVCKESEGRRGSGSCSLEELSGQDTEIRISTGLGLEAEMVLSTSDIYSISARFTRDESDSFRRYSSSGPLRTGTSRQFWQWVRGSSGGSVSEHGIGLRLGRGLEGGEQWL